MQTKVLWITRTAVFIALLIGVQAVTAGMSQLVTGSLVNFVLIASTVLGGLWCGGVVAVLSPLFAFLLGVAAALPPVLPFIMLGNLVFVLIWGLVLSKTKGLQSHLAFVLSAILAAGVKYLVLFVGFVQVALPLLGLPEKQQAALSLSFSLPQLFTALLGGALAIIVLPTIRNALSKGSRF